MEVVMYRGREGAVHVLRRFVAFAAIALSLALLAPEMAAAAPAVTVSPTSGTPGAGLTVSGTGWTAGHQIFVQIGNASLGTNVVCVLTANGGGKISGDQLTAGCQVPTTVPAGVRAVTAIDSSNTAVVAHGANFTVKPTLVLTPANGIQGGPASPGTTVTVAGHGFAAGSSVSFKFDAAGLPTTPASVSTDTNGSFSTTVTFTVPSTATAANHSVTATDALSNTGTVTQRVFRATVTLAPATGTPGMGLKVTGGGWPAGDQVFVQIGSTSLGTDVVCVLNANASGQIAGDQLTNNCKVPTTTPVGAQPLVAIDSAQQGVVAHGTNFTIKPTLVLTPANGIQGGPASPGTTVTVAGHGFAAGSSVSMFKFDAAGLPTTPASVSTDANGSFGPVTFTVPTAATAANHTITATDALSNTGTATQRVFRPTVIVSPTSGAPGASLTVSGGGWPAGDNVFVQIGSTSLGTDVVCQLKANASGQIAGDKFTNNCVVPSVGLGSQVLVGIDSAQQGVVAHGTNFNVT
jgi:hypothetical protein